MHGRCTGCGIANLPATLNAPEVYVGAAERRFGRFCSPALVYPDRSTGPDFLGQIVLLVLRDNVRLFVPFAHGQPGQTVLLVLRDNVRLFVPAFLGQ